MYSRPSFQSASSVRDAVDALASDDQPLALRRSHRVFHI